MSAVGDDAFPPWRRALALREAVRSDLLSLGGVFATAVALALATQISPGPTNRKWYSRSVHAVIVVAAAIVVLAALDLAFRALTYQWDAHRRSEIATRSDPDGGRIIVRSRDRERFELPAWTTVRVRCADGTYLQHDQIDPNVIDGGDFAPPELGESSTPHGSLRACTRCGSTPGSAARSSSAGRSGFRATDAYTAWEFVPRERAFSRRAFEQNLRRYDGSMGHPHVSQVP